MNFHNLHASTKALLISAEPTNGSSRQSDDTIAGFIINAAVVQGLVHHGGSLEEGFAGLARVDPVVEATGEVPAYGTSQHSRLKACNKNLLSIE